MRALGIILAGGNSNKLGDLSAKRAVAAMPITGSYRAIDFALSNMTNSHIQKVAVFTQYNTRSLNEHLNSSKWWDFGRKQGGLYIEVGGGIRTEERIEKYLSLGVGRCILGSVAVTNFDFTARMLKKYGDKIAVGVDARDGYVAIHGWKDVSAEPGVAFCQRLAEAGCKAIIYTDIACDGAMKGTNLALYRQLAKEVPGVAITASGGISSEKELLELEEMGTAAAILGKSLYTGALDLGRCVALVQK